MKFQEVLKKFYSSNFKCPSFSDLDEDFRQIVRVFFYLGYLKLTPSKVRVAYGVISFTFLFVIYEIGIVRIFANAIEDGKIDDALISGIVFSETTSFVVQVVTFAVKQVNILTLMKTLQSMNDDESATKNCQKRCMKIIESFKVFLVFSLLSLIGLKIAGFNYFVLILPAYYDTFAEGNWYYALLMINILHLSALAVVFGVTELIHVLCMVRVEFNLDTLANDVRKSTEDEDLNNNEQSLIACIKHHCAIIE